MNSTETNEAQAPAAGTDAVVQPAPVGDALAVRPTDGPSRALLVVGAVAALGLLVAVLVWQKLNAIQENLARQSADTTAQAAQAQVQARLAQEQVIELAAKLAVTEARLSEVSLQRTQLEDLMQSLSRSRDENLVVDIESAVRLAQQQAQLTGSVEPLLAALKSAETRLTRAAQPRLTPLQRALARDLARIKAATVADTPALLVKLDELVALADELPLANAVGPARAGPAPSAKPAVAEATWWQRWWQLVQEEARSLVRVSRVETPEAVLLSPEQSFFVRENLKLRLLNARLGLLSRQTDSVRADLGTASAHLARYFDGASRRTQAAATLLQQVQGQVRALELPRVDDTLTALATAAAGR